MYHAPMSKLFNTPSERADGPWRVVSVAVNAHIWREYDYLWTNPDDPAPGQRVYVPLGRGDRKTLGFVLEERESPRPEMKLKAVSSVLDSMSLFDEPLLKLARWISQYYLCPLGQVLSAMIPASLGVGKPKHMTVAKLIAEPADWPRTLGGRQKRALDELREARMQGVEVLALDELIRHSQATRESIRRLAARGLVELTTRPMEPEDLTGVGKVVDASFEPNEDQQNAMNQLGAAIGRGFSIHLLHGVTGSGKTEVYIKAIQQVIDKGMQAILLVPEIALASQTLTRLVERLPRVVVMHSALGPALRDQYHHWIWQGKASVVIGPRSAVFTPARKLGLIIVDEEHEPSYKQDTSPRYHGRDVAIMRARLTDIPVVLGSATPSLESKNNAIRGRYKLISLPRRVRNLPMPKLEIVPLRKEITSGRIELIGRTLTHKIAAALDKDRQVILLMNRRGYASYVFCPSSDWILTCDHCSRPMVYHQAINLAMCHHCDMTAPLPRCCPVSGQKLVLFGYGIQRIETELHRKFPQATLARMDSDTMTSPKQFKAVFESFASGKTDILLGTQIVAKGLDFPGVGLVGVVSADTSLAIPDFRASERTFQLIVQVAGRAGRSDDKGEVVVQTLHEDEPAIIHAAGHDYESFSKHELELRKQAKLPPFSRMVRFIVRHHDASKAQNAAEQLATLLRRSLEGMEVSIVGPMPAGVARVKNMFRFHLLLTCPQAGVIQRRVLGIMEEASRLGAQIHTDVDPVNLL